MKILVWNGSPRPQGNTAVMVEVFAEGARESGHDIPFAKLDQFSKDSLK